MDDTVNSLSWAAGFFGDIGSRAHLVGVVFAALNAERKRISDSEDTRTGFNDLYRTVVHTAQLVQAAESSSRSTYLAEVQKGLDSFWNTIYKLARLLYKVRGKGYASRLLNDSHYQRELQSIREQLDQAKIDIQVLTELSILPIVQTNLSITQTTAQDVREVKALLSSSQAPIDEAQYATAIKAACGKLLGFADIVSSQEGFPLRALDQQDVWVDQDVVPS